MTTWILMISLLSCMGLRAKAKAKNYQSGKRDCGSSTPRSTTESMRRKRNKHDKDPFSPLTVRLLFTRPLQSAVYC